MKHYRVSYIFKPYQISLPIGYHTEQSVFNQDYRYYGLNVYHNGINGYDTTDLYPFRFNEYYADGRIKTIKPEGEQWHLNHNINYSYIAENNQDKTTIVDENNVTTVEYRNSDGNIVKKITDQGGLNDTTIFTYDVLGNLTKSVPPMGLNYATDYTYNTLGQLTQKRSPDAGTTDYMYDKNGNLRLIKDANHSGAINNKNYSGNIVTNNSVSGTLELSGKGNVNLSLNQINRAYIFLGSVTIQIKDSLNVLLYTLTANAVNPYPTGSLILPPGYYRYTVQSTAKDDGFSFITVDYSISCTKNLVYFYHRYDKLNRIIETGEFESLSTGTFIQNNANNILFPPYSYIVSKRYFYDTVSTHAMAAGQRNLIGRLSYSESYRLGVLAVKTFYSYDEAGNIAWTAHSDLNGYGKKISYSYDLQGNVTGKTYTDYYPGSSTVSITNSYDKAGRLNTVKSKYRATSFTQEAEYQYFASSKLKRLKLGGAQGVDYRYNQRDWLTMINHQNLDQLYQGIPQDPGADGTGAGQSGLPGDKFGIIIGYNTQNHIGLPQYQNAAQQWNGNISWLIYRMKDVYSFSTDVVGYTFSYDKANRLRNANFGYCGATWMTTSAFDEIIPDAQGYPGYDKNGNIRALTRYNNTGIITDNFIYNYPETNNRLTSISGTSAIRYKYDDNGNVKRDSVKNIALIIYDIDNLPVTVYKTDGSQIQYYYDVNGNRVRKSIVGGSSTYYINGYDGKTEVVSHVPTGSDFTYNIWGNDLIGQVRIVGTTATRYYYLKDHLGNIRMTVNSAGNAVSWDDYYPFGSVMPGRSQISSADNRYKFTGKERDTETNYDYFGARYYDAKIARWLQVDPLDGLFPDQTPYNYCNNNPVILIDIFGLSPEDPEKPQMECTLTEIVVVGERYPSTSSATTSTATMSLLWGIAIAEPTPFGEILMSTATTGYIMYRLFMQEGEQSSGTQVNSKTLWQEKNGKGRIDVENPNPKKRPGQIHYQNEKLYPGQKFLYDSVAKSFKNLPKAINDKLMNNKEVMKAIEKGLKILGGKS